MKLPNGPKTPRLLQQIQWAADPISYMEAMAKSYGDIFTTSVFDSRPSILVSNPQALKQMFARENKDFSLPGKDKKRLNPLVGNQSLLLLEDESHLRQRKFLMPPFHGARMRTYGQLICDITEKVMDRQAIDTPFSIRSAMGDIALQVLLEAVFGFHEGERCTQFRELIVSLMKPLTFVSLFFPFLRLDLGSWSPWGQFLRTRQQIDHMIYAEIKERRQKLDPESTDILSLLMSARDEAGQAMTDKELRDQLMTLLLGGSATTENVMTWLCYWVHKKPDVQNKCLKELEDLGASPDPVKIFQLPYLTAVCNETLRIYPIDMFTSPRIAKSSLELMGYELSPGTALYGCIYLLHHRQDLYPEPKQFKPERFLERKFSSYEFMPFGGGVRRCIGEVLAQYEMKLVLTTIVSHYQLELADDQEARPPRATLAPDVKMVLRGKRNNPETARPNEVLLTRK